MANNVYYLCCLPSTDCNFISHLGSATIEEIEMAIECMRIDVSRKHKTRISACERELRKRNKANNLKKERI